MATTKAQQLAAYNPDDVGKANGNLFGLPFTIATAEVVVLPVPWEVTVSYGGGTANGPRAVLGASPQLDLFDYDLGEIWRSGIAMLPIPNEWEERSAQLRKKARACIDLLEQGADPESLIVKHLTESVNSGCRELHAWVEAETHTQFQTGKIVGLLGGDHSTPLGLYRALATRYPEGFGILQIDAHCDLRQAYEGFEHSHASIFFNALQLPELQSLVQVGIRDFCRSEHELIQSQPGRIHTYFDRALKRATLVGTPWPELVSQMIEALPPVVHLSFDIDGLEPSLCPNTGTPVPGGLTFDQAVYLIQQVAQHRHLVSFDLCEVATSPDGGEWDASVGARILYQLAINALHSRTVHAAPSNSGNPDA
jgi:agmatinase